MSKKKIYISENVLKGNRKWIKSVKNLKKENETMNIYHFFGWLTRKPGAAILSDDSWRRIQNYHKRHSRAKILSQALKENWTNVRSTSASFEQVPASITEHSNFTHSTQPSVRNRLAVRLTFIRNFGKLRTSSTS